MDIIRTQYWTPEEVLIIAPIHVEITIPCLHTRKGYRCAIHLEDYELSIQLFRTLSKIVVPSYLERSIELHTCYEHKVVIVIRRKDNFEAIPYFCMLQEEFRVK
jgi:hypothetical protein